MAIEQALQKAYANGTARWGQADARFSVSQAEQ